PSTQANRPWRSESATAEARRLHSLLTATCLRRSVGDGRRTGPGSVGMPYSRRRERRSGASTAGASAHPGSTPPRPQAALINSTCRCMATVLPYFVWVTLRCHVHRHLACGG